MVKFQTFGARHTRHTPVLPDQQKNYKKGSQTQTNFQDGGFLQVEKWTKRTHTNPAKVAKKENTETNLGGPHSAMGGFGVGGYGRDPFG